MNTLDSEKPHETKSNFVQIISTIGWILFGLAVVLIPLWMVFFVYFLGFVVLLAILYFLKEFLFKTIKYRKRKPEIEKNKF